VNRLAKLSVISLLALGAAGCHEARVTGPTQCFAPHDAAAAKASASDIVQGQVDPAKQTPPLAQLQ
jgi:hypothetical protein